VIDVPDDGTSGTMPGAPLGAEVAEMAEEMAQAAAAGPVSRAPSSHTPSSHAPSSHAGTDAAAPGSETTLPEPPGTRRASALVRARKTRVAVVAACLFVGLPVIFFGGRKAGIFAAGDSLDASLDDARDCMHKRAWDAPAAHNFKTITGARRRGRS
jgi:hypothetical protein